MERKKINPNLFWILLASVAVLLRIVLPAQWIETLYSRGLFIGIRYFFDYTTGFLPVPMLYVFVFGLVSWLFYRGYRRGQTKTGAVEGLSVKTKIFRFVYKLIGFLAALVFFFLFLWGYNYGRIPLELQLGLQPKPLDTTALLTEFNTATNELLEAYAAVESLDSLDFDQFVRDPKLEDEIRTAVAMALEERSFPSPARPRIRMLRPTGVLLRISTAGFYMPFVAECNVDAGLHPLQIPYVMAHELAHGYGFGNEGTCNFWAYLSCKTAKDPIIRYSGMLSYWRSVAAQYRWLVPDNYKILRDDLPAGIKRHMWEISAQMDKFPDIFPAVRDATYNAYLKAQGVEEGLLSYSRVVQLVAAYRTPDVPKK